MMFPKATLFT